MRSIFLMAAVVAAMASGVTRGSATGPGEEDYVQHCLKQQGVTEEGCRCTAREAHVKLPASGWKAMVLEAQGKDADAAAVRDSMSTDDRVKMISALFEIVGKCLPEMPHAAR